MSTWQEPGVRGMQGSVRALPAPVAILPALTLRGCPPVSPPRPGEAAKTPPLPSTAPPLSSRPIPPLLPMWRQEDSGVSLGRAGCACGGVGGGATLHLTLPLVQVFHEALAAFEQRSIPPHIRGCFCRESPFFWTFRRWGGYARQGRVHGEMKTNAPFLSIGGKLCAKDARGQHLVS